MGVTDGKPRARGTQKHLKDDDSVCGLDEIPKPEHVSFIYFHFTVYGCPLFLLSFYYPSVQQVSGPIGQQINKFVNQLSNACIYTNLRMVL